VLTDAQRAALAHMTGVAIDAAAMEEAMRWADARGQTIDSHSAIALAAAHRVGGGDPMVVLATAHPAKFPEAVHRATGRDPTVPARLTRALAGAERVVRLPADVAAVAAYVAARG